jgi:hypothetical protein
VRAATVSVFAIIAGNMAFKVLLTSSVALRPLIVILDVAGYGLST